jgi:hypothetical protein
MYGSHSLVYLLADVASGIVIMEERVCDDPPTTDKEFFRKFFALVGEKFLTEAFALPVFRGC